MSRLIIGVVLVAAAVLAARATAPDIARYVRISRM
jgi:hypothetical protein